MALMLLLIDALMQDVPRDPIDALNDDDREYDESQEDTPSVDQGY